MHDDVSSVFEEIVAENYDSLTTGEKVDTVLRVVNTIEQAVSLLEQQVGTQQGSLRKVRKKVRQGNSGRALPSSNS